MDAHTRGSAAPGEPRSDPIDADLFEPVQLGPVTVSNRVFYAPTSVGYAEDGAVGAVAAEHYGRRALGGAGAVMTEHLAVSEEGWQHRRQPAAWPDPALRGGLEQLFGRIRDHGAVPITQLSHAGRYAGPWDEWAARPRLAPSAVPVPILGDLVVPQPISVAQIAGVVAAFAAATRWLVDAGCQGIEIHGGSGFLVSSFLSPLMNRRTDDYGGDPARRVRIAQEIVAACRDAAGADAVVGVHLMTDELAPGGVVPAMAAEYVRPLESAGAQFFRPGSGTFETLRRAEHAQHADGHDFNRAGTDALLAVATVPVIANGGLRTGADARAVVRGGASAVALARPLLADPDWPRKVRAGAEEQVVACPCSPPVCLQTQLRGAVCAAWPDEVRERGHFGYTYVWTEDALLRT